MRLAISCAVVAGWCATAVVSPAQTDAFLCSQYRAQWNELRRTADEEAWTSLRQRIPAVCPTLQAEIDRSLRTQPRPAPNQGGPKKPREPIGSSPSQPPVVRKGPSRARLQPGQILADCEDVCPQMVVLPTGEFTMGDDLGNRPSERPARRVRIARKIALSRTEITRAQWSAFVTAGERERPGGRNCNVWAGSEWKAEPTASWREPGFSQEDNHPAVCISWEDAKDYAAWLSEKAGANYRLPTEAEWEWAARAPRTGSNAIQAPYFFGSNLADLCDYGNGADSSSSLPERNEICSDGFAKTSPVGHYAPNAFGLHDTMGNAFEWTEDCVTGDYRNAPRDGHVAVVRPGCPERVLRGGSWFVSVSNLRSAFRGRGAPAYRGAGIGFRLALDL